MNIFDEIVQKIGFFPTLGAIVVGLLIVVVWIGLGGKRGR